MKGCGWHGKMIQCGSVVPSFTTYVLAKAHLGKAVDGECLQWGYIEGERIYL